MMLLKKIRTKGFLGHLSGEAENDFVELDFADKNLWLIQGRNGAGKSTLFDAITMAFYKEHRGGGKNFTNLIHDKADKAEVFVEFALHGNDYRIAVDVPKKSTVVRHIQFWNGVEWATKNDDIDEWVRKNLKIKYETFVSSVLLRQGEADRFITAKPTPRREIFLELLQLEFYKKLTERAKFRQKCVGERLIDIKKKLEGLENPSATEIKNQEKEMKRLKKDVENLERQKSAKKKEYDDAKQAQKLKTEIGEIQTHQKRDEAYFAKAEQVEEKYRYFLELKESLLRIENVWREKTEIVKIENDFENTTLKINQLNEELEIISGNLTKYLSAFDQAKNESLESETQLASATARRDKIRQKLDEIARFENFEKQIEQANEDLREIRHSISKTKENLTKIEGLTDEKRTEKEDLIAQVQKCQTDFHIWSERLENRRKIKDKDECPTCGNQLKREEIRLKLMAELEESEQKVEELGRGKDELATNLAEVKEQVLSFENQLKNTNKRLQELLNAETGFKTKIETWQSQITILYTQENREKFRLDFAETENQVKNFNSRVKAANENLESLRTSVGTWEKSKVQNETNLKNYKHHFKGLEAKKTQTEAALNEANNQISDKWLTHPALQDEAELKNLRREKEDLLNIEKEYKSLSEARNRRVIFNTKIETLTKQLEEIPQIHCREIFDVQAELSEIDEKLDNTKNHFSKVEENCRQMIADKKLYDEKSLEMKSVKEDFEIWKKLTKAFGKDGLETKVVREAQLKISENANKTLKALSNGKFEIRLEDSGKEMRIFVRDFTTGENRQVEYCSGGEKFLTAVSLAVAIGQSASGQNIANTLIIDEGFGALDDKNRVLMVNELSRLTDIFQNGRVIIVSHQDDVRESFANCFRLSKTDGGITSVEMGTIL